MNSSTYWTNFDILISATRKGVDRALGDKCVITNVLMSSSVKLSPEIQTAVWNTLRGNLVQWSNMCQLGQTKFEQLES